MAFLSGWLYRKPVTLSRASGAVTNYQMKLKVGESAGATGEDVDCGGKCKADFSDLRFTAADGTTLLDYYIEDVSGATPNQLATIWIEFDSIGTGDTTFYMYYGNAGASAVSNGPNTFILFEDFNALTNGDLNGQNGWSGHVYFDVESTTKYEGAKAVATAAGGSTVNAWKTFAAASSWRVFIQARLRSSSAGSASEAQININEGTNAITAVQIAAGQFKALVSPPSWVNIGKAASSNIWYKIMIALDSTTTHKTWVDDTLYTPANVSNVNTVSSVADRSQLEHYAAGGTDFFDQIMVGYYLPTGPAWGVWGGEEESSFAGPFQFFSIEQPLAFLHKKQIVGY